MLIKPSVEILKPNLLYISTLEFVFILQRVRDLWYKKTLHDFYQ